jgi:hypothetical protein
VEQKVLADRLDRLEQVPVEPLYELLARGAWMRGLDFEALSGKHLQPLCSAMQRVALWHAPRVMARGVALAT